MDDPRNRGFGHSAPLGSARAVTRAPADRRIRYYLLALLGCACTLYFAATPSGSGGAPSGSRAVLPAETAPGPAPTMGAVVREHASWLPDGRLWLKATDELGAPVDSWAYCWALPDARQVRARLAEVDGHGWARIEHAPRAGHVLIVGAEGREMTMLHEIDPSERTTVVLDRLDDLHVFVRDVETLLPVADATLLVSKTLVRSADAAPPEDDPSQVILPGPDPATAIYTSRSDHGGRLRIGLPRNGDVTTPWSLAVSHDHYLLARSQQDILPHAVFAEQVLDVQMPAVGAIRYQGGEILQQALRSQHAPPPEHVRHDEAEQLLAIRRRLIGGRPDVVAVAFLPELARFRWGASNVRSHVTLRRGGERIDTIELVRYRDYVRPQLVCCDPSLPEVATSQVLLRPPTAGAFSIPDVRWRVIVSGDEKFRPIACRLGDTVELPVGQYRLKAIFEGSGALKPLVYDVVGTGSEEFVTELWDDVYLYEVQIHGNVGKPHVQFRVGRDGEHFIVDAACDEHGMARFWSRHDYQEADLFVPGWMEEHVVFPPGPIGSARRSSCALLTRRPAGVVPR